MAVSPSPASQPDATAPPLATRDDSRPTRLAPRWRLWWTLWGQRHVGFVYLLCFFVAFRLLALLLLRPGGFITDFSDYDFYMTWGTLGPMGYRAYDNLWTAYPPLFPLIMLTVYEWASRIPPWTEPRPCRNGSARCWPTRGPPPAVSGCCWPDGRRGQVP